MKVDTGGSKVKAILFILNEEITEAEAKSILWRRETRKVGSGERYSEPSSPKSNSVLAGTLTNFEGVNVVVFTDFPYKGKLHSPTAARLAKYAVDSARNAKVDRGVDGISYLIAAKSAGIVTPLMSDYLQEILKLTQTDSLEAALAKCRSGTD